MQAAESPGALSHLADVAGSTFCFLGHVSFTGYHLVKAACNAATIPFSPFCGTLETSRSLLNAGLTTVSAIQSAGSAVVHTAGAVSSMVASLIPGTT